MEQTDSNSGENLDPGRRGGSHARWIVARRRRQRNTDIDCGRQLLSTIHILLSDVGPRDPSCLIRATPGRPHGFTLLVFLVLVFDIGLCRFRGLSGLIWKGCSALLDLAKHMRVNIAARLCPSAGTTPMTRACRYRAADVVVHYTVGVSTAIRGAEYERASLVPMPSRARGRGKSSAHE